MSKSNTGRGRELVKNTAIVAIGKVCTKFLSFFLLPFYTAVLSTEDYGIVDLFGTYTSLLLPVIAFQIEDALFRFAIDGRGKKEEEAKVISTVTFFCLFQSGVFAVIFLIVQALVDIPYRWYLMANVIISIFSGAILQLARGLGDNMSYAVGSFLTALAAILMNIVLVLFWKMGADGLFITGLLSNLAGVLYIIWKERVWQYIRPRWFDRGLLKRMLEYSLPLVPNYLSWWVMGASDKSVVTYFLGVGQNGILSVSQKFSTAYTTFYSIFNLTWTENAAIHCKDEDYEQYLSEIIEKSFCLLSCACLGIIAAVALIFPWLINIKFGESYYQIPIYMLASLLYSVIGIFSVVYIAYKKTGKIAQTSMLAAAINLIINIALVRTIGLYAASISSAVAYGVLLALRLRDIRRFIQIRIHRRVILMTTALLVIDFVVYYIRNNWLSLANLLLIGGYSLWINRRLLGELLLMVKEKTGRNHA